jgi:uncharacterized repeat protein (TIGR01451 family)
VPQTTAEAAVEVADPGTAGPPAAPAAALPPAPALPEPAAPDIAPPPPAVPRQESRAEPAPGSTALLLDLTRADPALEVGREMTYEIRVLNRGAAPSRDVLVQAVVPDEMALVDADGPTGRKVKGREVAFAPLSSLDAQGQAVYRVRVKALKPGDGRFTARLQCGPMDRPVSGQVITRVYNDGEPDAERKER